MYLKPYNLRPCILLFVLGKLVLNIIGSSMRDIQIAQKLFEERLFYQRIFLSLSKIISILAFRPEIENFLYRSGPDLYRKLSVLIQSKT